MLTRVSRMGRKCGNELIRKDSLGTYQPSIEPTPEKVRNPSRISHLQFLSVGPNGSSRPLATSNPFPRSTKSALAPGYFSLSRSLALSLSSLLSPRAFEDRSLGKPLENPDFGVMLASDMMMISPAI